MKLRLSWTDPVSQRPRRPLLHAPIALGQTFAAMPAEISGQSVSRMVIGDRQVLDFQALLVEIEGEIYLIDNGGQTYVNQQQIIGQERLNHGDRIRIGETELQCQMIDAPPSSPDQGSTHLQGVLPAPALEQSLSLNGNDHHKASGNGNYNDNPETKLNSPSQANIRAIHNIPHPAHNSGPQPNDQARSQNGNGANSPRPAATAQPMQLQSSQPHSGCRRSVGFLFKRPCGRNNSSGCDQCANGYSNHAYSADYALYEGYGRFEPGDWGYGLLEKHNQH